MCALCVCARARAGVCVPAIGWKCVYKLRPTVIGWKCVPCNHVCLSNSLCAQIKQLLLLLLISPSAKIPLDDLPHGDITLRVRNYLLEIVMTRGDGHATCDRRHLVTKPCKYGEIDLPIYVNPTSLRFHVDEASNVLHMHGQTKVRFHAHERVDWKRFGGALWSNGNEVD